MNNNVKIINPVAINSADNSGSTAITKRKVAAYARVSTGSEEQATSFTTQVREWTKRITDNKDWEFVKVYTDEGISGTSAKKRVGFNEMIRDAMDGKIDLILCKSISRLGRNTLLVIQTVRDLKAIGVEVWFDLENISSLDPKSELIFSILCSIAQEESRHTSERISWSLKAKMTDGIPLVCTSRFLGYDKSDDGKKLVINEAEAEIVKLIFNLYDSGMGCLRIAHELQKRGYKTAAGNTFWHTSTVTGILKNEKYVGDLLQQKMVTVDYLNHIRRKNTTNPYYLLENAHDPIISRDQRNRVQSKLACSVENIMGKDFDRSKYNNKHPLSGVMVCTKCGHTYKRRIWNSKHNTAKKYVYQCTHYIIKDEKGESCHNVAIGENVSHKICCDIINNIFLGKTKVFSKISSLVTSTLSSARLEAEEKRMRKQKEEVSRKIDEVSKERSLLATQDLKERNDKIYKKLLEQQERIDNQLKNIVEREITTSDVKDRLRKMLDILGKNKITPDMLTREIVDLFFYKIFVVTPNELVFVVDMSRSLSLHELIEEREIVVQGETIYRGEEIDYDSRFKNLIKYRVVLV